MFCFLAKLYQRQWKWTQKCCWQWKRGSHYDGVMKAFSIFTSSIGLSFESVSTIPARATTCRSKRQIFRIDTTQFLAIGKIDFWTKGPRLPRWQEMGIIQKTKMPSGLEKTLAQRKSRAPSPLRDNTHHVIRSCQGGGVPNNDDDMIPKARFGLKMACDWTMISVVCYVKKESKSISVVGLSLKTYVDFYVWVPEPAMNTIQWEMWRTSGSFTCMPELTRPNMACLPSSHCVGASVMKNWEPFVSGPELAIDRIPAPAKTILCLYWTQLAGTFFHPIPQKRGTWLDKKFISGLVFWVETNLCVSSRRVFHRQTVFRKWTRRLCLKSGFTLVENLIKCYPHTRRTLISEVIFWAKKVRLFSGGVDGAEVFGQASETPISIGPEIPGVPVGCYFMHQAASPNHFHWFWQA